MTHLYSHIDNEYVKSLNFNIDKNTQTRASVSIKDMPQALTTLLEEYHIQNIKGESFDSSSNYNYYLARNNLHQVFPSLSTFQYMATTTESYLDNLRIQNTSNYDRSHFNKMAPIAVRYTNGTNLWLIERPPFLATVTFKTTRSSYDGKQHTFDIWMPWTCMFLDIQPEKSYYDAYMFFNDGPITSLDEQAIPCIFPNMYSDGHMCLNQSLAMLQQHLYQVNSFDVSTIYNFLINDYMSGGWNIDLGIQVFDQYRNFGPNIANAYKVITRGIDGDKRYKPSISPATGRVSYKKYITNFLNYFSLNSVDQTLNIISEIKETAQSYVDSNKISRTTSYADIIQRHENKVLNHETLFSISNTKYPLINHEYKILINPSFYFSHEDNDPNTNYDKIAKLILSKVEETITDQLTSILQDNDKLFSTFYAENNILYFQDEDNIFFLDSNESKEYYQQLLGMNQEAII